MELNLVKTVQGWATPFGDVVMNLITLLGGAFFLVFVFLVFYYAIDKNFALNFIIATTFVSLLNYGLKLWIKRPRPYIESVAIAKKSYSNNFSFASGHSVSAASIASGIIYKSKDDKKNIGWISAICIFMAILVGFSRIYLGHHYLTDVITGLFMGAFLVPYLIKQLNKIKFHKWFSLALAFAGFVGLFLFINQWFIITERVNALMACGGVCGLGFGMFLEFKFIKFDIKTIKYKKNIWWVSALSIIEVALLFIVLNFIPKWGILVFLTLFVVGFFATFVQMLFLKLIYRKIDKK